jgi:predicted metalloprotease
MIKENGKIIRCEKCGSDKIIRVHPFDYVKMCMNDKCPYHINHPKNWRWQFVTGVHN